MANANVFKFIRAAVQLLQIAQNHRIAVFKESLVGACAEVTTGLKTHKTEYNP